MTTRVTGSPKRGNRWSASWIAVAVVAGGLVAFLGAWTQGTCYDSPDPTLSYCESGPVVGIAGMWIAWVAWAVLAAHCVYRAMRRTR